MNDHESNEFPPAHLSAEQLSQLRKAEEALRASTGEDIVLIAYEHKDLKTIL
ncbi:hypothetical protein [Metabacillus lacus]|uniref:hypothetical protein n=1 Tax=Metabacillus lacus TaxID=1983721 RepID=UPI0012AF2823|nr:hypothetical protein [Metabacillus lacus]